MKKAHLKWFLPLSVLVALLAIACFLETGVVKKYVTEHALTKISETVSGRLFSSDLILKTAVDYNDAVSLEFGRLNYGTDKEVIVEILDRLAKNEKVFFSIICDSEGNGFDNKGKTVSIRDESYYDEIRDNYAKGGSGFVFVRENGLALKGSVAIVNRVTFEDEAKGYLITYIDRSVSEGVLGVMEIANFGAIVTMSGDILVATASEGDEEWERIPGHIPLEKIKLSISQNSNYISEIEDYGYVLLVTSIATSSGAVMFFDYDRMNDVIKADMKNYYMFVAVLFSIVFIYIVSALITLLVSKRVIWKKSRRMREDIKRDEVTGLYSRDGAIYEIDKFISDPLVKGGILFYIVVENFTRMRMEKGEEAFDRAITDFAEILKVNFRVSDIVGRMGDDGFVIFMKDIVDEKEVRKQTDEFQLLMYDIRNDSAKSGSKLDVCFGSAFYPGEGKSAGELIDAALKNVEVSRKTII